MKVPILDIYRSGIKMGEKAKAGEVIVVCEFVFPIFLILPV